MQRCTGKLVHETPQRFAVLADLQCAVGLVHGVVRAAVGKPRGVTENVPERYGLFGRAGLDAFAFAPDVNLKIAPGGDHPVYRVVELEHAALVELHERDRSDRLAHRIDAEDRIVGHRQAALEVSRSERRVIREMAVARDGDLATGDLAGVDVVLHEVVGDAPEPRLVESRLLRVAFHDFSFAAAAWWKRSYQRDTLRPNNSHDRIGTRNPHRKVQRSNVFGQLPYRDEVDAR